MSLGIAITLGIVAAIVCTILSLTLITPDHRRAGLNKFFAFVHDLFNFKSLLVEKILKALYVFNTLTCITCGFFLLFSGYESYSYFGSSGGFQSFTGYGLALMIVGPIVVRIVYECMMMFILLVKNTIQINNKLQGNTEPTAQKAAVPEYVFCAHCGTRREKRTPTCPNCGR